MREAPSKRALRVGLISLGCAKNLVDAEIMLGTLLNDGVEIINDTSRADAVIINTCSFIDSAQEESVDTILQSAAWRDAKRRKQALIVSGCLPQRFREQLARLLPEVDAFMGLDQVTQVTEIVQQALARRAARLAEAGQPRLESRKRKAMNHIAELAKDVCVSEHEKSGKTKSAIAPRSTLDSRRSAPLVTVNARTTYILDHAAPRLRLTPRHFAYVKIAEGCNHPCSFCTIPRIRGRYRSRPQADILGEAKALLAEGTKELNLISQDSTGYGLDLRPNRSGAIAAPELFASVVKSLPAGATTICTLLRALDALPGDFWIRLLYTHPAQWTDELIQTIADCPKVARYVDIPLQHIHENMLRRMRRGTSRQSIMDLLERIRAGIPGIALRTTFIVGFPGETEKCFVELLDFIREAKFERLGVFTYSQEEGTVAGKMASQIPAGVKQHRRDLAMAAQREVAVQVAKSFVGRTLKVLVEGRAKDEQLRQLDLISREHGLLRARQMRNPPAERDEIRNHVVARSEADAPDIDGQVYVRGKLPAGEFAWVRVIGHTDYDLLAEPLNQHRGTKPRRRPR